MLVVYKNGKIGVEKSIEATLLAIGAPAAQPVDGPLVLNRETQAPANGAEKFTDVNNDS